MLEVKNTVKEMKSACDGLSGRLGYSYIYIVFKKTCYIDLGISCWRDLSEEGEHKYQMCLTGPWILVYTKVTFLSTVRTAV